MQTENLPLPDLTDMPACHALKAPPYHLFLQTLCESRLINPGELEAFLLQQGDACAEDTNALIQALLERGLLNKYQVGRLLGGQTFGLVLGNYRIVDVLGTGGMGVVYRAEHIHMKRVVALKVLAGDDERNSVFLQRFYSEMQALAVLRHPNIVLAFDAGEIDVPHAPNKVLRYLVMEHVVGKDLEQLVQELGPLPIAEACEYVRQVAEGLRHAHEHGLVHRDIKPSNLLVTPEGQIKILDFGLARLCRRRCTEAYAMLGTVDYMSPEQARDARTADIRSDIFGLGGTFYWMLTGKKPFPGDERPMVEELMARQFETPVPIRRHRPDIPLELEAIVCQMMAQDPNDRYATPLAVISALNSFMGSANCRQPLVLAPGTPDPGPRLAESSLASTVCAVDTVHELLFRHDASRTKRLLIVTDDIGCFDACRAALERPELECVESQGVDETLSRLQQTPADAVLVDMELGCESRLTSNDLSQPAEALNRYAAIDLCRRLKARAAGSRPICVLLTPIEAMEPWEAVEELVDDQISKSASPRQLAARLRVALRLKELESQHELLAARLQMANQELTQALQLHTADMCQAQEVLILALARLAELGGHESGSHLRRMQEYVRILATEAAQLPAFTERIDSAFIHALQSCVLLHDIGKAAIPDHVLLKPGRLDAEERSIMESHTLAAADFLGGLAKQHVSGQALLTMAAEVARHHHERFDGAGYPDNLAGEAIPLAARIVAVADVYDAMRSKLVYKPGLSHATAKRLILESSEGQFDPNLLIAFRQCAGEFEQVFEQIKD